MYYDNDLSKTTLIDVNGDECMKVNACMLPMVIFE